MGLGERVGSDVDDIDVVRGSGEEVNQSCFRRKDG